MGNWDYSQFYLGLGLETSQWPSIAMRLPMVARTRPDPVTPVSLEGKNASASEVPETRDTSTSTRSNMAMVFVGVVLGLSFLAFVLCTTTRYLRRRRMQKLVYNRNTDGKLSSEEAVNHSQNGKLYTCRKNLTTKMVFKCERALKHIGKGISVQSVSKASKTANLSTRFNAGICFISPVPRVGMLGM